MSNYKLWSDLPMSTRANYIRLAVALGLKSIDDIRDNYNEFILLYNTPNYAALGMDLNKGEDTYQDSVTLEPLEYGYQVPKLNVRLNPNTGRYDIYTDLGNYYGSADALLGETVVTATSILTQEQKDALNLYKQTHGGLSPYLYEELQRQQYLNSHPVFNNMYQSLPKDDEGNLIYNLGTITETPKRNLLLQVAHNYLYDWYMGTDGGKMAPLYAFPAAIAGATVGASMPTVASALSPYITPAISTLGEATGLLGSEVTGLNGAIPAISAALATPTGQAIEGAVNLGFGYLGAKELPEDIRKGNIGGIAMDALGMYIPTAATVSNTMKVAPKVADSIINTARPYVDLITGLYPEESRVASIILDMKPTTIERFYHGSPVRFDTFSIDAIGSGEGGRKALVGINLWPEGKQVNAPKFANMRGEDTPIHLGRASKPLLGERNPTVYDVEGTGLNLFEAPNARGIDLQQLLEQGYDGIRTNNQVTVFPESIDKLNIVNQRSIPEFIEGNPRIAPEDWTKWSTRDDYYTSTNTANWYNLVNQATLVNDKGEINWALFDRIYDNYKQSQDYFFGFDNLLNEGQKGTTNLRQHLEDVVKTAQLIPVPKGYTRQLIVEAALLHDLGKLYGAKGIKEGQEGKRFIETFVNPELSSPISNDVIDAVFNHMNTDTYSRGTDLTKALLFSDVARGLSYDEAAVKYPHLLTYNRELPKINYPNVDLKTELRDYINPWLKRYGYDTIDINSTEEQAEKALESIIKLHRTYIRGTSIPRPNRIFETGPYKNQNILDHILELLGVDVSKIDGQMWYNMTDEERIALNLPIKDDILDYNATHIPAGSINGRKYVFDSGSEGLKYMKISPETNDVSYMSTSEGVGFTYAKGEKPRLVTLNIEPRQEGESLRSWLQRNDLDIYLALALHKGYPKGTYDLLEGPYRLLTGRSLLLDMINELENIPEITYYHKDRDLLKKPLDTSDENVLFQINANKNAKINPYGRDEATPTVPFDAFTPVAPRQSTTFTKDLLGLILEWNTYNDRLADIENINVLYKNKGIDFSISLGKNLEIFSPNAVFDLNLTSNGLVFEYSKLNNVILKFNKTSLEKYDTIALISLDITETLNNIYGTVSMQKLLPEKLRKIFESKLNKLCDTAYNFYYTPFSGIDFSMLENVENTKKAHKLILDILKFMDKYNVSEKRLLESLSIRYKEILKLDKIESSKTKVNYLERQKVLNDYNTLLLFLRRKGVVPKFEQESFNKTVAINTNDKDKLQKPKTKNKDLDTEYIAVVGDFDLPIGTATEFIENGVSSKRGNKKDIGERWSGKVSRKVPVLFPFGLGTLLWWNNLNIDNER